MPDSERWAQGGSFETFPVVNDAQWGRIDKTLEREREKRDVARMVALVDS